MYCVKKITNDMYWVGASDRRLALFENVYPIPRGVSYNAYLLMDEKTVAAFKKYVPESEIHVMKTAGHFPMETHSKALRDYLRGWILYISQDI